MPSCNILIGCSGSVSVLKIPQLVSELIETNKYNVKIVLTKSALFFLEHASTYNKVEWERFCRHDGESLILIDEDEWEMWTEIGDPVLHIEARKWADVLCICPASADLMAKISHGVSDNLLLCIARAWDHSKPAVLCPAMNTVMWNQKVTNRTIDRLTEDGWLIIHPVVKTLACREVGNGALAAVGDIIQRLQDLTDTICVETGRDDKEIVVPRNTRHESFPFANKYTSLTSRDRDFSLTSHSLLLFGGFAAVLAIGITIGRSSLH